MIRRFSALPSEEFFRKPSVLLIIFSACFAFWFLDFWKPYNTAKKETNFHWDVFNYYSYLPAIFCNNGSFDWSDSPTHYNPYGPFHTPIPKTTYGMALLYSPFFAIGYKIAVNQDSPRNGFSEPFATCVRWGSIFYVLLGLAFLRAFLLKFFNEQVTALTLGSALFGTMLFHYTYGMSELTHGYLFTLFSIFLYLTLKWHEKQTLWRTFWLAFILGLISLVRPTEIFIAVFFIFWNVRSFSGLVGKVKFFFADIRHLILVVCVPVLIWIPQLIFWKAHTGHYFYDSYKGERFFWSDPQIFNILFSYRKGWITYTPLVVLTFIGFFFIRRDFPVSKWVLALLTAFIVYLLSCWWDWFFGGCFGARGFCQDIAFLAIPLASLYEAVFYSGKKFALKGVCALVVVVFLFSCVCLNIGQSYQFLHSRIHPSAMSKKVYWDVFRKFQFDDMYGYTYWGDLNEPVYSKLLNGEQRDQ